MRVETFICINGKTKAIEENIASLIQIKYGEDVDGTKEAISCFVKQNNVSYASLIGGANVSELKESFKSMCKGLEKLEQIL